MRAPVLLPLLLVTASASAQPRTGTPAAQGTGYSVVGDRPRVAVTSTSPSTSPSTAPTAPSPRTAATSTVTVITTGATGATAAPAVGAAPSGPRGPSPDGPTVTITNTAPRGAAPGSGRAAEVTRVVGADGNVVVVQRAPAPAEADAGVADPNIPTTGALYGGPLPGPSIAYMGLQVDTRRPWVAPPLAPGAVLPGHALPASTPAPPPGAAPWVPYSTSGFQLGPGGTSTETSGYGFSMPSGTVENPGTLRNPGR